MSNIKILWADDEIDFLKPHILFLQEKGYEVETTTNGVDALDMILEKEYDIVFLDEHMPGLSGLETLTKIKTKHPGLPVVMITKSEDEPKMEEAIGSNISDYLIKPVNPNQILLCLKKNLETKKLVSEKTTISYQQQFRNIAMDLAMQPDIDQWKEIYRKLIYWELELEKSKDHGILEVLKTQKNEANTVFSKFIEKNYQNWLAGNSNNIPLMSHTLLKEKAFPLLDDDKPLFIIVIDNFRYDQWKTIQPLLEEYYRTVEDDIYCSILPTATMYARNGLFSGLLPTEIEKKYSQWWVPETEKEELKNKYEEKLLGEFLKRFGKNVRTSFTKILNINAGKKLVETIHNLLNYKLNVIVYNFVDLLSHARTDMEVLRELAEDESAYRSLTYSWFEHSPLMETLRILAEKNVNLLLTTDHGSIRITDPVKVIGDRDINPNLRYKVGKALDYNPKEVFEIKNPQDVFLSRLNVSSRYIFCRNNDFFVYPNNFNYYVNYYKNTFQHGGISMEEMLIPVITLKVK